MNLTVHIKAHSDGFLKSDVSRHSLPHYNFSGRHTARGGAYAVCEDPAAKS